MADVTSAQLATRLVVEACLPMIQDKVRGQLPIPGRVLTLEERVQRGMADAGTPAEAQSTTISYQAGASEVLLDLDRSQASVWFFNGDCDQAMGLLDEALKRAYTQAQQVEDKAHPDPNGMRVRLYRIELDPALIASVEVSYPASVGAARQFVARVRAQIRRDVHDQVLADYAAAQNQKKN